MLHDRVSPSLKSFRAVLRYAGLASREVTVEAASDLDALCRAQDAMGTADSFVLYEGQRLVATFHPQPGLQALVGNTGIILRRDPVP